MLIASIVCIHASPATKRDIGIQLRQQAVPAVARHHDEPHYGNGIRGADAKIVEQHFNQDERGNYDFS